MEISLYIDTCGLGSPSSANWYLSREIEVQRLYYILGGIGQYAISDGQMCPFRPGYLYLFPYNLRDHFVSSETDPIRHLYFDFLSTPPIVAAAPLCCPVPETSPLRQAISLAEQILLQSPGLHLVKEPLRTQLLQLILTLMDELYPIPYSADSAVCQTLHTIQTHYHEKLTVSGLALEAGFEENYFIRRFRSVMGLTPYAYLRNYRLMQARRLLSTGVSLTDAAALVGYETPASLSRALRGGCG